MRTLHTNRLTLRGFEQTDLDAVLLWDEALNERAGQEFLDYCFREYTQRGIGPWAMELKKTGAIVGNCGLPHIDAKHRIGEVNYYVAPNHRRQGFATEALQALLEFGFDDLALDKIQGRCPPDNLASERVLQKARMKFERLAKSDPAQGEAPAQEKLYRILKKDFEPRPQTQTPR